ncbi:ArsR family transcriptional regulator [bacterium]|nr:MAG: ArsR family transcriptional regulator [bacterium]
MEGIMKSLKALGDESRVRILWMLEERPLCVCEIQEALGLAQSTVSRHLQLLEEAGFVTSEKEGQWRNYKLNPSPIPAVSGLLSVVRLCALAEPEALELRERVKTIWRENICCKKAV